MDRYRWWHRLRGHRIRDLEYDPLGVLKELDEKGYIGSFRERMLTVTMCQIVEQCSCGDEWVFSLLRGPEEIYVSGGGVTDIPSLIGDDR